MFDAAQAEEVARVTSAIGGAVLAFCRARLRTAGGEFHGDDLRAYVAEHCPCAPGSPDRILRALRRAGQLDYQLISRRKSLYRVTRVA